MACLLLMLLLWALHPVARAQTYISASTTYSWVDPATHTNVTWSGLSQCDANGGSGLKFTRSAPVAAFNADISLAINVIDSDGIAYATNPARSGAATSGSGIAFSSSGKAQR